MEDGKIEDRKLTPHQARLKAESYCAYQERSQQEVRNKLYDWGLFGEDVEDIIAQLIADNFLNEERFAKAFVSGRFKLKGWGKIKIKQHLKAKKISEPLIRIALREIDDHDYEQKLNHLLHQKVNKPISDLTLPEKAKLVRYLQSKGFENELIFEKISNG